MTERPIIFSAEMVRAILEGRKTQTRRPIKHQPHKSWDAVQEINSENAFLGYCFYESAYPDNHGYLKEKPYAKAGDRLWVREAWRTYITLDYSKPSEILEGTPIEYSADGENVADGKHHYPMGKNRPSLYMMRWMSRVTLEVKRVWVERVQDISEDDAKAEGCTDGGCGNCGNSSYPNPCGCDAPEPMYADAFCYLWNSIYAGDEIKSWNANPWVWCVEFEVVK